MPRPGEVEAMRRAIRLAAATRPHPNPRVGAVVLDPDGRVLAEGVHLGPGQVHAEVAALDSLGSLPPSGATLVVTLEPCTHSGRTPPCTDTILASGIERVIVGAVDPDRRVAGGGLRRLRDAGLTVEEGVLSDEVEAADPAYFLHRRLGRPRFTLKQAMTLDGQTAARDGTSRWITGEAARADAHRLRAEHDAVLVGSGTLRADDPRLDVRLPGFGGPQPTPVVVAGAGDLPQRARLWENPRTLVVSAGEVDLPVEVVTVAGTAEGWPHPSDVARVLAERGLLAVLVEGGPTLVASLWSARVIDHGVTYLGALVAAGAGLPAVGGRWETVSDAQPVDILAAVPIGSDVRIDWRPVQAASAG